MEHLQEEEQRDGVLAGVEAVALKEGGSGVSAYDITGWVFRKLISTVKKTPAIPGKALRMVPNLGSGMGKSRKVRRLETGIGAYEKKMKKLYYKIGKEGISHTGTENVLETEPIKTLIDETMEIEMAIERLSNRIIQIKERKRIDALKRAERRESPTIVKKREKPWDSRVDETLEAAIAEAVRFGEFETPSEKEIFQKVANDLLDNEMEVRILAATELAKMGKEVTVPVLLKAAKLDNADLTTEVINALISIGDLRAVPLLLEKASDPGYRIRIGCLRGLYKLADDRDAIPILREALQDAHPEVRRTAATFLGWKDRAEAAPALVQCLRDEDGRVRKAAVSALANLKEEASVLPLIKVLSDKELEIREKALRTIRVISGEDGIAFDVSASGSELKAAVNDMRDWWEKERLGRIYEHETDMETAEAAIIATESALDEDVESPELTVDKGIDEEGKEVVAMEDIPGEDTGEKPADLQKIEQVEEDIKGVVEERGSGEEVEAEKEAAEKPEYRENELKRMLKTELQSVCHDLGIEVNENLHKSELISLVLGEKE